MAGAFGAKIRELRKEKGLTLDQLAEKAGSSKSYIWELENKNPPRPSADKIAKIASVLGVTADYIIGPAGADDRQSAVDLAFFRKYQAMDGDTKEKIRKMLDVMKGD